MVVSPMLAPMSMMLPVMSGARLDRILSYQWNSFWNLWSGWFLVALIVRPFTVMRVICLFSYENAPRSGGALGVVFQVGN